MKNLLIFTNAVDKAPSIKQSKDEEVSLKGGYFFLPEAAKKRLNEGQL